MYIDRPFRNSYVLGFLVFVAAMTGEDEAGRQKQIECSEFNLPYIVLRLGKKIGDFYVVPFITAAVPEIKVLIY